jgi:hypothetical protein
MNGMAKVESVVMGGDLSPLTAEERLSYYRSVCESLKLNPLTRPFEYLRLNGKLVLYARRDATDQLRTQHGISIVKVERDVTEGIYVVTVYARNKDGREDSDIGAVSIQGLQGEAKANAVMKCLTKAKRRVTLSICGLGMPDESEVESIPGAERVDVETGEVVEERQRPTVKIGPDGVGHRLISEAQLKRFHAIARGGGWTDAAVKGMLQSFGIASSKDIPREQYEELCAIVAKAQGENPSQEEVPF